LEKGKGRTKDTERKKEENGGKDHGIGDERQKINEGNRRNKQ